MPAAEFEVAVATCISRHLADRARRLAVLADCDATSARTASESLSKVASDLSGAGIRSAAPLIRSGRITRDVITVALDPATVASALGFSEDQLDPHLLAIEERFQCRRRGVETRIVAGSPSPTPDATSIRALRNARAWSEQLRSGTPLARLAKTANASERYMARIMHLDGLSPSIKDAIVSGRQPIGLTLKKLLRQCPALDWNEQDRQYGFHR